MKIALYVHDLFIEIGHSNALIEQVNNFPEDKIKKIYIFVYSYGDLKILFPNLNKKTKVIQIPFPNIKPFIIKELWYLLFTFFYNIFFLSKQVIKIGIGTACFNVDISNVQFVHSDWKKMYFESTKFSFIQYLYKKILFLYFDIIEYLFFHNTKKLIICLSKFVKDYIQDHYKVPSNNLSLVYSSTNMERFKLIEKTKIELINSLSSEFPDLLNLDTAKPIYLFIGAFERKGGPDVIKSLKNIQNIKDAQLIIVGKTSDNREIKSFNNLNIIHIQFTNRLQEIYSLADCFVFPTIYEPFGLVITEAAAMGLQLIVTKNKVGASEILHDLKEIYLVDSPDNLPVEKARVLSISEKLNLIKERREVFEKYNWSYAGKKLFDLCSEIKNTQTPK